MKKRALVSLVLLVSILMVMAETVIFQEDPTDPVPHCVDGHVYVWNSQNGQWESPNTWEDLNVKIYSSDQSNIYAYWNNVQITNGYYCKDTSSYSNANDCNRVRVCFRGEYYYAVYNHSTGTTIDIWFYPDR
jgi:hypothetical protein